MERTCIILKPDCMQKGLCGKVITRFESEGLRVCGCKMVRLDPTTLRAHYAHIADKPFYPDVEAFMGSKPVIILVLEGEDVIERARTMLGVTDSRKAAPGTIRREFGVDQMVNIAHASDSKEMAEQEIQCFFQEHELF